jgi:hypothetical protein
MVCLVKATRIGKQYYCYEVVKLKTYPDQTMFGDFVPAHEGYPGDEDWGTYGFTYRPYDLVKARQRLATMVNALGSKPQNPHEPAEQV